MPQMDIESNRLKNTKCADGVVKKVDYKKLIRNGMERKRKSKINEWIEKIINLVPFKYEFDHNVTRSERLAKLYDYIIKLKDHNDALMYSNGTSSLVQEINTLRQYIEKLEQKVKEYRELCLSMGITTNCSMSADALNCIKPPNQNKIDVHKQTKSTSKQTCDDSDDSDVDFVCEIPRANKTDTKIGVSLTNQSLVSIPNGTIINRSLLLSGSAPQILLVTNNTAGQIILPNVPSKTNQESSFSNLKSSINSHESSNKKIKTELSDCQDKLENKQQSSDAKVSLKNNSSIENLNRKSQLTTIIEKSSADSKIDEVHDKENDAKLVLKTNSVVESVENTISDVVQQTKPNALCKLVESKKIENEKSKANLEQPPSVGTTKASINMLDCFPKFTLKRYSTDSLIENSKEQPSRKRPATSVIYKDSIEFESEPINQKNVDNQPSTASSSYMTESLLQTANTANGSTNENNEIVKKPDSYSSNRMSNKIDKVFTQANASPNTTTSQQVNSNFRFESNKDSIGEDPKDTEKTLTNLDEGKQRNLYLSSSFEILDNYSTGNIFNDICTPSADNRMTPNPIHASDSGTNAPSKSTFEMSSFVNQQFPSGSGGGSGSVNTSNSTSTFFPTQTPVESSSYSSYFGANHQTPFPSILPTPAASFETFGSSPHKGSNLASLVSNTASATSSVFNNNFMPDFNSSSFYSSVSNLEPTTSESTNTSTTTNYTPRRSERKKTTSTLTSSSSKAIGTRKATSKKSANAQSSNASVDLKYSNLESSSSANLFNSKRHFNDNYFLIPDIISPSTTASGNNTNNTNSFAISVSGSHHPVPVVSNFSSVDHSSSSHFSNRYNFFTSTSEQPSYGNNRHYEIDTFTSKSNSTRNSETVHCGQDNNDSQSIINYPNIFRPQNSGSITSTNSVTTTASAAAASKSNYNSTMSSRYHPPTTSASGSHVPNFNLSNIFPDITLTPTTTASISVNSYLPTSNVDLIGTAVTSNSLLTSKHLNTSTYGRFSQSNSDANNANSQTGTFLTKFSHMITKQPIVVGSEHSFPGTNANDPKATFYSQHHHHHHPHHQNSGAHSHHANHYSTPFYPPTQHNFPSHNSASTGNNISIGRISNNNGGGQFANTPSGCDNELNPIGANSNRPNGSNYTHLSPNNDIGQNTLQTSFSFPYPPPPPHIQPTSGSDVRMSCTDSNVNASTSFNAHHQATSLGSFGRTSSGNVNTQNGPPPPPPPHLTFPIFNLTRTDL